MHLTESEELLEVLQRTVRCPYLSDLHDDAQRLPLFSAVKSIPATAYRLKDWREAAKYIASREFSAETAEAVRNDLLLYLSRGYTE